MISEEILIGGDLQSLEHETAAIMSNENGGDKFGAQGAELLWDLGDHCRA